MGMSIFPQGVAKVKLRFRLYLSFGVLFVVAIIFSFVLEQRLKVHDMAKAEENLNKLVMSFYDKRRESYDKAIADSIGQSQAKVAVLLDRISTYSAQAANFAPTDINLQDGTWINAAILLLHNKWIDFIQNTNEEKLSSLIIPDQSKMDIAYRVPVNDNFCWVVMSDTKGKRDPYVGVKIATTPVTAPPINLSEGTEKIGGISPETFVLFHWTLFLKNIAELPERPPQAKLEKLKQ